MCQFAISVVFVKHSPCEFLTSYTCRTSDKRQPWELDTKLLEANASSWLDKDGTLKKQRIPKVKCLPDFTPKSILSVNLGPGNDNYKPNIGHVLVSLHVGHALCHLSIKTA